MNPSRLVAPVLVLGFVAGVLGNVVSQRFLLPGLSAAGRGNGNVNATLSPQRVVESSNETAVIKVAREVSPSVVSIVVSKELPRYYQNPYDLFFGNPFGFDPFPDNPTARTPAPRRGPVPTPQVQKVGGGTGFVVTSNGLVMTNRHVVEDPEAEYTVITQDGTEYRAEVVTRDTVSDMAFVRMKTKEGGTVNNLPVVKFVPDSDSVQVGQSVVAIGNALAEFDNTVTTGVVSGKGRQITAGEMGQGSEELRGLLQTDASINPGNSGGPLVDLSGEVIGINTAIAQEGQGIGFSIPLDQRVIGRLLDQVTKYGRIVRPYLGIRYVAVTPELDKQYKLGATQGAWIRGDQDVPAVIAGTPSAKAGLKGGDIVISVNGEQVTEKNPLQDFVANANPGDTVTLRILRDGKQQDVKVTLDERKEEAR